MDTGFIVDLINNIGFPIAITIILIYILVKQQKQQELSSQRWQDLITNTNKDWQNIVSNNTQTMHAVLVKLEDVNNSNKILNEHIKEIKGGKDNND